MKRTNWKNRRTRLILIIFLFLLILLAVPTLVIGELIYNASRKSNYEMPETYNNLTLMTPDNVKLQAWFTNSSSKVVLLVHGHSDHSGLIADRYAPIFKDAGFDVMLLDMRNHGKSAHAPPVTMGIKEHKDVITALQWVEQQNWDETVLFGTSMGSIAAILAQNVTQIADKIIIDSAFSNPIEVMNNNFEKNYVIQPWRFLIIQYLIKFRTNFDTFPDILSIMESLEIPTLVAHGSSDVEAPPTFLLDVDDLDNDHIQTIMVHGGSHSELYQHESFVNAVKMLLEV